MKISEVLGQAKEVIRTRWIQGRFRNGLTGQVCSLGAIYVVAVGEHQYNPEANNSLYLAAHEQLSQVIKAHQQYVERVGSALYASDQTIASFNDDYRTSKTEILALFEEAERRAKLTET
jgi:hypothetical protein